MNQRVVRSGRQAAESQLVDEETLAALDDFERSPSFTERERTALRYTDAICWNPEFADDALWEQLHEHFSEPELVELGSFVGYISGGQRWIRTLGIRNGEVLAETTVGLSPQAAAQVRAGAAGANAREEA